MSKRKNKKTKKKKDKFMIICLFIFFLCISGMIVYYLFYNSNKVIPKKQKKKLTIVDENSNQRPLAVMIDNNVGNNQHAGLQDSYINYEIIVEGGLSRIMALYKDKDVELIGPVRSSRHYYLDYALESDAIYTHYGWSDFAKNDISALNVDNINGLTDSKAYWRDKKLSSPHNVFTNTDTLYQYAKNKMGYSLISNDWQLLNYSVDKIDLYHEGDANSIIVNQLTLKYSNSQITEYHYDHENQYYLRSMNGKEHLDKISNSQLHYKNILIEKVKNFDLDSYGRQDLETVGSGEGYYVTNGYAVPIAWQKDSRKKKTKYTYLDGTTLKVNDGNTFIQIVPIDGKIEFN